MLLDTDNIEPLPENFVPFINRPVWLFRYHFNHMFNKKKKKSLCLLLEENGIEVDKFLTFFLSAEFPEDKRSGNQRLFSRTFVLYFYRS